MSIAKCSRTANVLTICVLSYLCLKYLHYPSAQYEHDDFKSDWSPDWALHSLILFALRDPLDL